MYSPDDPALRMSGRVHRDIMAAPRGRVGVLELTGAHWAYAAGLIGSAAHCATSLAPATSGIRVQSAKIHPNTLSPAKTADSSPWERSRDSSKVGMTVCD